MTARRRVRHSEVDGEAQDLLLAVAEPFEQVSYCIEAGGPDALSRRYEYYDPIRTLPAQRQEWWCRHSGTGSDAADAVAAASREAARAQSGSLVG